MCLLSSWHQVWETKHRSVDMKIASVMKDQRGSFGSSLFIQACGFGHILEVCIWVNII